MARSRTARCTVAALALAALSPAVASATTVLPAQPVAGTVADPTVAVDAAGTAYLVGLDGVTSIAPFGGALGAPERLLAVEPRPWDAVSGVSADGTLIVAYTRNPGRPRVHRRVRVVTRTSAGAISAPVTISQAGRTADTPALAVGAQGEAIAAFIRHDADARWHVQYAVRAAGAARFGPPRTVPGDEGIAARGTRIDVAVRPGGGGVLTWGTRPVDRRTPGRLMALVVGRDGTGTPTTLEKVRAGDSYGIPHARTAPAYAADGTGIIAWIRPTDPDGSLAGDTIVAASLTADAIGGAKVLAASAGPVVGWSATAAPGATATVVWASYPTFGADAGEATATVRARTRSANGTWSGPSTLSHPGVHTSPGGGRRPSLLAIGAGDTLAVWGERSRYASNDDRLWWSARLAGGAWSPPREIAAGATMPAAAAASGRFALTWVTFPPGAQPGSSLAFGTIGP